MEIWGENMVNQNKRFKGCKKNQIIKTMSFGDYIDGFCKDQPNKRIIKCKACGGDSVCTFAEHVGDRVHGIFTCTNCKIDVDKYVNISTLREMFGMLHTTSMSQLKS